MKSLAELANLALGERRRVPPVAGDLFAITYPGTGVVFGRVIDAAPFASIGRFMAGIGRLVYVYGDVARQADPVAVPDRGLLRPDNLLIAPLLVNDSPWVSGAAQTIANVAITESDMAEVHCFEYRRVRRAVHERRGYIGLDGRRIGEPVEPTIPFRVHTVTELDAKLSEALGLPAPPSCEFTGHIFGAGTTTRAEPDPPPRRRRGGHWRPRSE